MVADKKILLVDDDTSLLVSLSAGLTDEGYSVVCAEDGKEALAKFDTESPDLVVLDLMLPGLNGTEVCRAIRRRSPVPIIMLTAKKQDIDKIIGLEIGADDYVTKPFNFRELLARAKSVLRRPWMEGYEGTDKPAVIGDLCVDIERREVQLKGNTIPMPTKEFELLSLLISRPGRVFERDELLSRVWGDDFCGDEKTLDVHVRRLRTKIEPDPAHPRYILTVRGIGYRMAEC